MYGPGSNETDNNDSNSTANISSINQQDQIIRKVDCAILGAGAAGLQCATTLLGHCNSLSSSNKENSTRNDTISLIVLEARDRIGGRILTTNHAIQTIDQEEVLLCRDHGAAWVHGIHESNPMMQLLAEEVDVAKMTVDKKQPGILNPVFEGNPWVRPHTVLHGNGRKGENSLISFFVDGQSIPDDLNSNKENAKEVSIDPSIAPTTSSLTSRAIIRHYRLLREIVSKYNNSDESDCDHHNDSNVDHLYQQLNRTLEDSSAPTEDQELVRLLTPFYLYLMENWNGISMKDTEVDQVEDLLTPESSSDNEEEKKDDSRKHLVEVSETDEHYVSAGDFVGPHCKVKTGMVTVLKPLVRILEEHQKHNSNKILCLGEEVVSIIDKTSHVQIETKSGTVIEAKCCVSTIPLGCLQHSISLFQPRLRRDKVEAINSIWSGSYKKVFLTFDHIFWPKDPPIIGLVRKESGLSSRSFPGRYLLLYNLWARDRKIPSVEAILCGDLGKWAFSKSDHVIKQAVMDFIEEAMGLENLSQACTGCHVTRWEEDEFTRGSYSAFQLGTQDEHVEVLGAPEWDGRLIFAGEATENDHMGSVHAALISGKRAAQQVLGFLPNASTTAKSTPKATTN